MPNTKTVAGSPEALVWAMLVSAQIDRGEPLANAMHGVRQTIVQFSRHIRHLCADRRATIRDRA